MPTAEKSEEIAPLKARFDGCEEQIDILNVAVRSHVTDEEIHPRRS